MTRGRRDAARRPRADSGFTMAEISIVLLVLAVLAFVLVGGPSKLRDLVEDSRARAARLTAFEIARANRMRAMDKKSYVTGGIDGACSLVAEGRLAPRDWTRLPYVFEGAESRSERACIVARTSRRTSGPGGTSDEPYSRWGFCVSRQGIVAPFTSSGSCPLDCSGSDRAYASRPGDGYLDGGAGTRGSGGAGHAGAGGAADTEGGGMAGDDPVSYASSAPLRGPLVDPDAVYAIFEQPFEEDGAELNPPRPIESR